MQALKKLFFVYIFLCCSVAGIAQSLLNRVVTLQATKKPLSDVLNTIGEKGKFYFSYNSNILKRDSLVSLNVKEQRVEAVLDMLFKGAYEYKESGNYIIIQRASGPWYIEGHITDITTGENIMYASIYEKQQLASTMTNEDGYFRLKLKEKTSAATIYINKTWYADTSIIIKPGYEMNVKVSIYPKATVLDSVVIRKNSRVERSWFGGLFLSSRQRIQGMNIDKFFVDMPYQTSFIPGVSTHGRLNSQITNKISFNVLGGYSGGTDGFELGGLFNIVRRDSRYAQIAGLFNLVGGKWEGVQIAGILNNDLDSVKGVQIGGISNVILGSMNGVQIAGIYNHVPGSMKWLQIAGISNYVQNETKGLQIAGISNNSIRGVEGMQIAGICNLTTKDVKGVQVSGIFNIARKVNGSQIGLINIADSSKYSIGLISLVRKGYHKLSFSANEVQNLNATLRLGTKNLYNIFTTGWNAGDQKVFSFGYGYGAELSLGRWFSINPELSTQHLYLGDWQHTNLLNTFRLNFHAHFGKYFAVYAGPSFNVYYSNQTAFFNNYKPVVPETGYATFDYSTSTKGWIGWNAGINIF